MKRFKDSKPFKLTHKFSQTIKRKYFIYYDYRNKFIFCEVIQNDPKSPYLAYKQIGFMDCDTKNLLPDKIEVTSSKYSYYGPSTYTITTGKEYRGLKSNEFSMIYQTDSLKNFMNKFNFEIQQESQKYNL